MQDAGVSPVAAAARRRRVGHRRLRLRLGRGSSLSTLALLRDHRRTGVTERMLDHRLDRQSSLQAMTIALAPPSSPKTKDGLLPVSMVIRAGSWTCVDRAAR